MFPHTERGNITKYWRMKVILADGQCPRAKESDEEQSTNGRDAFTDKFYTFSTVIGRQRFYEKCDNFGGCKSENFL
jgi:hypothetical protein